ncbi:MAG: glycine zipper domain-containing protein [Bryobacteraceae bacterium]
MNLTSITRMTMILAGAAGLALAAQGTQPELQVEKPAPAAAAKPGDADVKQFLDAMSAIGTIFTGTAAAPSGNAAVEGGQPAEPVAKVETEAEGSGEGSPAVKQRSARNTMILITGGAAAGAAIGSATGKGTKGAIVGAAIGAAAGLIYDRATYKNPGAI